MANICISTPTGKKITIEQNQVKVGHFGFLCTYLCLIRTDNKYHPEITPSSHKFCGFDAKTHHFTENIKNKAPIFEHIWAGFFSSIVNSAILLKPNMWTDPGNM
jgi:hypothetical protein